MPDLSNLLNISICNPARRYHNGAGVRCLRCLRCRGSYVSSVESTPASHGRIKLIIPKMEGCRLGRRCISSNYLESSALDGLEHLRVTWLIRQRLCSLCPQMTTPIHLVFQSPCSSIPSNLTKLVLDARFRDSPARVRRRRGPLSVLVLMTR